MELNQSTLRGILAQITSVDEKFIVPKQGNWWNPQENLNQPDTWCAYLIRSNTPRTAPFYIKGANGNQAAVEKIATIDLQFVGQQAEELAQTVAFWNLRTDVNEALKQVQGSILYSDKEAQSSNFYQQGSNNVLAWNTTIKILWFHLLDTNQGLFPNMELNGYIKN